MGQGTVGDIGLAHRVHAGMEQGLGVPHAHLAGGAADAAHRGLEQGLCPVGGESQNFLGLGAGEVDNIGRLVGGQAHLGPVHVRQGVAEGAQGVQVGLAADGVPGHGVQAGLLLRNDPGPGHRHAVPLLGDRGRGQVQVQFHPRGEHRVQLLLIGPGVALRPAADVLHIAGAGLAPVFIVAVGPEGLPHGLDVVEDLVGRDPLGHLHAELGVVAQAAGGVYVELPVRPGGKAQVPIGGVGQVGRGVGEADLQLAGHLLRLDKVHGIIARRLGIGHHVEILANFHAGQGGAHGVPGEVAAAAHGDDAVVQGLLHDGVQGLGQQVVELNRLAGGKVGPGNGIGADGLGHKGQLVPGDPPGGHAQAEHTGLAALLGIAAVKAGKALIGALVQGPGIKFVRLLPEGGQVLLPALGVDGVHSSSLLAFCPPSADTFSILYYYTTGMGVFTILLFLQDILRGGGISSILKDEKNAAPG